MAITSPIAGTTRDRVYHETELGTYRAILVDTAGLNFEKNRDLEADIQEQAKIALEEAHVIFFVVDASEPMTANDFDCAKLLHKSKKHVILIANKIDVKKSADTIPELFELGLGEPVSISSIHNLGITELQDAAGKVLKKMKWKKERHKNKKTIDIAIVGKPNVGKSSLVNALLGKNRVVVSNIPGTTVDSIDTPFTFEGTDFVLIDTAGLRRRGKANKELIERLSVLRALQAISRSDVACLVLDFENGIANQDLHVSQYILDINRSLIIVVNKCDLMNDPDGQRKRFMAELQYKMGYVPWAPVIFVSALTKKNTRQIWELSKNIDQERKKKIPDAEFEIFTKTIAMSHPVIRSGKSIPITKGQQIDICPPSFMFWCSRPDKIHFSYKRFLENEIRRRYGFFGTPIKIRFSINDE